MPDKDIKKKSKFFGFRLDGTPGILVNYYRGK